MTGLDFLLMPYLGVLALSQPAAPAVSEIAAAEMLTTQTAMTTVLVQQETAEAAPVLQAQGDIALDVPTSETAFEEPVAPLEMAQEEDFEFPDMFPEKEDNEATPSS